MPSMRRSRFTMQLIGSVPARGRTPAGCSPRKSPPACAAASVRDPSVAVEVEAYRPFFISRSGGTSDNILMSET